MTSQGNIYVGDGEFGKKQRIQKFEWPTALVIVVYCIEAYV